MKTGDNVAETFAKFNFKNLVVRGASGSLDTGIEKDSDKESERDKRDRNFLLAFRHRPNFAFTKITAGRRDKYFFTFSWRTHASFYKSSAREPRGATE